MIALFIALAATATTPQGKLIPKQVVVAEFGDCLVRTAPRATGRLLMTPLGSSEEARLAHEVSRAGRTCLGGRPGLSLRTGAIRGAIAEAALARDGAVAARARALTATVADRPARANGRAFVIAYATCLVHSDPARSLTQLGQAIASQEERAAFLGFGDALTRCMPEKVRYNVDVTDVRNHIAAVLYQDARGRTEADNA
ncbi:hypothetical protein SAMN06297144_2939 [Sphingomonas guangdongensis]|uniref:Uncharacterized protein n=1 Tax=Sphingomonas guangdongensis TaxID=1141890 RepID=A0A285R616_9SPHN|nr:hypothetical protein [Sphingomonas guangdongensis]SOB87802.1 hypothetical protein SAMN06297144_2939 [Sphingomonas guangdongensis]